MATPSTSIVQTENAKSVDASLWWDSFTLLLTELENVSLSADLPPPLVKKLTDNHVWFLDTVSLFKPPNQKSREALNSPKFNIGPHQLTVQPELKDAALTISSALCLDEVQSYILVKRSIERNTLAVDLIVHELLHLVMLQIFYQSSYPEHMDVDLFTLWAEEILIEDNLVLDIIFLAYYESFCTCNGKMWKKLCLLYEGIISGSVNFRKLAISAEALNYIYHAKVQLLLILIETLDLENLLQMIHDEMPFRQGSTAFSLVDVQEMDAMISSFNAFETKEAGPLILTWAVFLCLISSLPEKGKNIVLMEIDHVGYVHQAFEVSSLNYFLEILQSNILKDSDGPIAGYRSVLRTFISAFIASYEISLELEDNTLKLILDILCKIYQGEESLCIQFWDRDSFIDGPIRCLLCNLEGEFPFRIVELVKLLSALSEGTWPAECVYNFLDKSVGLLIPSKTRGHVLKVIDGNTALVRWEYTQSGLLVLLFRLAQELYSESTEESLVILDLLNRLVSFNMAVCYALMGIGNSLHVEATSMNGYIEKNLWVNVGEIICTLVKKSSTSCGGAVMMSMGVNILVKMLKCSPSLVSTMVLKANIFDVALKMNPFNDGLSSGTWLLSGRLAKMLLIDCEHNDRYEPLTLSGMYSIVLIFS
ncbi:hypothetical protein F0562_028491 [Nyssa sinensis]|uniref:Uncharacterized protein n=1 Tax=Nyssa sinensis TaxID=561372 RepID=A0A5J5AYD8_9ASTE|nr:hypothetical protein F0562_028491 [Nyssa sinensis]